MMGIASISKTFAAAEVLKLAAAGKIDVDAPLSRYIRHPLTRNGATVRQALGMVGGIHDFTEPEGTRLWRALVADCDRHWTMQQALAYQTSGTSAPGRSSAYSSPGYLLLGMVIEAVTGREPAASDLFTPACLNRISAQDRERPTAPLAAPAKNQAKLAADGFLPCRSVASSGGDAATGIAADAPTIAWWGYQLYGARLLPPDIAQAMMTPLAANEIFPGIQYGLGTMAFHVHFGVDDSFGHQGTQPGYNTLLAVVPALHISATVFIPDASKDPYPIMRNLLSVLQ
jgi:D-alanyl-D-alanine carboxypeptidase